MDIAIFTLSDDRIANILQDKFKAGVKIRIITDNDTMENKGNDVHRLAAEGIPTKEDVTEAHMHHKVSLVQRKACRHVPYK